MEDSKYAVCEEYEIPNVNVFDRIVIPIIAPRFDWSLLIGTTEDMLYTAIISNEEFKGLRYGVHYSIQFLNQNDPTKNSEGIHQKGIAKRRTVLLGDELWLPEVLNEENGFLKNGIVKVRVCLHIESIMYQGYAPIFNIAYEPFDCIEKGNTLRLEWMRDSNEVVYIHHQAAKLHSKTISDMYGDYKGNIQLMVPSDVDFENLRNCLQIMHGVYMKDFDSSQSLIKTAYDFRMKNVIWLIERQLIEVKKCRKRFKDLILDAIKFRMEKLLKHLLMDIDTIEEFKEILQKIGIYKMSSESMKTVVARFLAYE